MKTLIVALLLLSSTARAQSVTFIALAEYRFGEGYYAAGEYENALNALLGGWAVLPIPEFAYDIALTYWKLDAPYMARMWLRRYYNQQPRGTDLSRAYKLGDLLAQAIDEDIDANGLSFACDLPNRRCAIAAWSPEVLAAWIAFGKQGEKR